jgi:hypothetical protein
MATYNNTRKDSPISAVEFIKVPDGNFTFFYVDSPSQKEAVKQWLTSKDIGQEIIAETKIHKANDMVEDRTVIVTHGDKTEAELRTLLAEKGDNLELKKDKQALMDFWTLRSAISVVGQSLQIMSSYFKLTKNQSTGEWERKGIDGSIMSFAVLNMVANVMGFVFGSQKSQDENQLDFLKKRFNEKIEPHLPQGQTPVDPKENCVLLREGEPEQPGIGQRVWDFLQRNSVRVGEIGLRFAAATALVFPMTKSVAPKDAPFMEKLKQDTFAGWGALIKGISEGRGLQAFKEGLNSNKTLLTAGCLYLFGKTIALFTKVKDPFDKKPSSMLDKFREDYIFQIGSITEAIAGLKVAENAYNGKIELGGKQYRDWAGSIGGVLFATGYYIRLGAKFGEKQMNMKELQAHITDNLAKVPPAQLPQLIAESAASLKDHFKEKPLEFGQLYAQMMSELYRYHHISLDNLGTEPQERLAKIKSKCEQSLKDPNHPGYTPEEAVLCKIVEEPMAEKHRQKSLAEIAARTPATSHVEKAMRPEENILNVGI